MGFMQRTSTHLQRFTVSYEYPVIFTQNVFSLDNLALLEALQAFPSSLSDEESRLRGVDSSTPERFHDQSHPPPPRVMIFLDSGVRDAKPELINRIKVYAEAHSNAFTLVMDPIIVTGGEDAKNDLGLVTQLQQELVRGKMDRHAYVLAIGGGAILDLIGYVAATTHRGVRHIRIPTTTLSQGDGGVGVKNGVNAFGVKNLLGTFAPPHGVIVDSGFLLMQSPRDRRAGLSEAVKVALLRDASFFCWLEEHAARLSEGDLPSLEHAVRRSAELHMDQIVKGGDPFERGSARPLDYGHWSAHKLEKLSQHALNHGEAVAIGIALDTRYAVQRGLLPPGNEDRVCRLLQALGFHLWHDALEQLDSHHQPAVLGGLQEFREHMGGTLTVILLKAIGTAIEVHEMDESDVSQAIEWLRKSFSLG